MALINLSNRDFLKLNYFKWGDAGNLGKLLKFVEIGEILLKKDQTWNRKKNSKVSKGRKLFDKSKDQ